jgi:hypothetical protein
MRGRIIKSMQVPESLQALALDSLVGASVAEAEATVAAVGGTLRAVAPGQAVTADYRPTRVTVTAENGRVTAVHGIG